MDAWTLFSTYTWTRRDGSVTDHDSSSPTMISPLSKMSPAVPTVDEVLLRPCCTLTPTAPLSRLRTKYFFNGRSPGSLLTMVSTSEVTMFFSLWTTAHGHISNSALYSSRSLSSEPTGGLAMKLIMSRTFCRSGNFDTPSF